MKLINYKIQNMTILNKIKAGLLSLCFPMLILMSCNKDLEQFPEPSPVTSTGLSLAKTLQANDTLFYLILEKGGMLSTLNDSSRRFTVIAPTNAAMKSFISAATGGAI